MPVYAATSPAFAERHDRPNSLAVIIGAHAALLALVLSAKMDLPTPFRATPTQVELIEVPTPPKPVPEPDPKQKQQQQHQDTRIDQPDTRIPLPPMPGPSIEPPLPMPVPEPLPLPGSGAEPTPRQQPAVTQPVRTGPRFATPDHLLKPPYPASKLDRDEEASLRLRLSIDERGRVTSVEPVGSADPVFLAAARKHLIARWRYKPATEDGLPVPSTTVITLRFELEE